MSPGAEWRADAGVRPDIVDQIARRIAGARRTGTQTENLPEELYPIWDEIYPVHDRVHELLGREAIGWKMGAASREVQRAEGMPEPIIGRIYPQGVHATGSVLGPELFIGYRLCESEFVLTLGEDLPDGPEPLSREVVQAAVATVRPGLEVGDMVFPDWYATNPFWGACLDNAGGSQLVLGPETPYRTGMDLADATMALSRNGELVRVGSGSAALGDPIDSAVWMVNRRRARGDRVPAGTLLSTGTCTGHTFAERGDDMTVDFGDLGVAELRFG
jgi:2-keto-4-pentenoate hydratase